MSAIAPDQDDDNQFFNVLTEPQDSESSGEEQIPTNQSVLQQVQPTGSGIRHPNRFPLHPRIHHYNKVAVFGLTVFHPAFRPLLQLT